MGAGIVECDVAVTSDGELVCRHSQCDLHTTTNILATPLASRCSTPFTPADPAAGTAASVSCCTSDITLAEFKTLCGKMDARNTTATTVAEYMSMSNTAAYRTDLYSDSYDDAACPEVVSHAESIAIINAAGRKFTPELKTYTQGSLTTTYDQVRQKMVDEYRAAHIEPSRVWLQSFNEPDVLGGSPALVPDGGARPPFDSEKGGLYYAVLAS
jgi:glycerophosphoryl diester phosphodiesterase